MSSPNMWADPEIEFVMADGPTPGSWTGLDGMARATRETLNAWEDARVVVDEYRQLDRERVLVLLRRRGRGKSSGLAVDRLLGTQGAILTEVSRRFCDASGLLLGPGAGFRRPRPRAASAAARSLAWGAERLDEPQQARVAVRDLAKLADRSASFGRVDESLTLLDRLHANAHHHDAAVDALVQLGGHEARPVHHQLAQQLGDP
jgi:hypothetical protein